MAMVLERAEMIKIYVENENAFIWNAKDVFRLRKKHRIIGSLVGCFPKQAFQNSYNWLPLQLMPEEALLLEEKGIGQLVRSEALNRTPNPDDVKKYWEYRNNCCDEQIIKFKEGRLITLLEKVDVIVEGKKRRQAEESEYRGVSKRQRKKMMKAKLKNQMKQSEDGRVTKSHVTTSSDQSETSQYSSDSFATNCNSKESVREESSITSSQHNCEFSDRTLNQSPVVSDVRKQLADLDPERRAIVEKELSRLPNVGHESCMVQLFTECIWKKAAEDVKVSLSFPSTELERLRYAVFKDLWEKNYYITAGMKFGGDFLAYAGDPVKFHALFIVLCIGRKQNFCASELITYGRLGNQVKKSFVLASLMPNGTVDYISFKWAAHLVSTKYSDSR